MWPPAPENEARIGAYIAAHGQPALQAAVSGGQCEFPDGLFYGGVRPAWSNGILRQVLREHGRNARALAWIDFHTGLGPRGHGEKIYSGAGERADFARVKAWWGADVTSFHDGSSTSAPLTGVNYNAAYDECPHAEYAGIALEYGTLPFAAVLQALRADQWLANHPDAPAAVATPIKRAIRDAFYQDADDWKATVYAQAVPTREAALEGLGASWPRHRVMNDPTAAPARSAVAQSARLASAWDGDVAWSFRHSPVAIASLVDLRRSASSRRFCAPWLAPHNPFDLRTLNLGDALSPPRWIAGGKAAFLLGTDDQGRDVLSAIMFGARISLLVGLASVVFALVLGVTLGLIAGYVGGKLDAFIMRIADVQLSFPAILIALLIDGVARVALPRDAHDQAALFVLVLAIGLSNWVQYARTVRGSTMVEKNKEYVQAARVIGIPPLGIMRRHLLPNVLGPVLVLATINIATAIITEATLSFLGVGVPPTQPSLGTLIRDRQRLSVLGRMVDHHLSGRRAGDHGACRSTCSATGCAMR